jgi:hypothetical protein
MESSKIELCTVNLQYPSPRLRQEVENPYYDWHLVKKVGFHLSLMGCSYNLWVKVCRSLEATRLSGDTHGLMSLLNTCTKANFAGTESARLYSEVSSLARIVRTPPDSQVDVFRFEGHHRRYIYTLRVDVPFLMDLRSLHQRDWSRICPR